MLWRACSARRRRARERAAACSRSSLLARGAVRSNPGAPGRSAVRRPKPSHFHIRARARHAPFAQTPLRSRGHAPRASHAFDALFCARSTPGKQSMPHRHPRGGAPPRADATGTYRPLSTPVLLPRTPAAKGRRRAIPDRGARPDAARRRFHPVRGGAMTPPPVSCRAPPQLGSSMIGYCTVTMPPSGFGKLKP